jgi:hypothetical protein
MSEAPALVHNTVDPEQVETAKRKEKRGRERDLDDFRAVHSTVQGRRFIWRLLEHCKPFGTVIGADANQTYANAGRQDVGHFLLAEIGDAKPEALLEMQQYARQEAENRVPPKKPKAEALTDE